MADQIQQCEALTRKKAWNNPHAPLARCKSGAVALVWDEKGDKHHACGRHGKLPAWRFVPHGSTQQVSR